MILVSVWKCHLFFKAIKSIFLSPINFVCQKELLSSYGNISAQIAEQRNRTARASDSAAQQSGLADDVAGQLLNATSDQSIAEDSSKNEDEGPFLPMVGASMDRWIPWSVQQQEFGQNFSLRLEKSLTLFTFLINFAFKVFP